MKIKSFCRQMVFLFLSTVVLLSLSSCDEAEKTTTEEKQSVETQGEVIPVTIPIDETAFTQARSLQQKFCDRIIAQLSSVEGWERLSEEVETMLKNSTDDKQKILLYYHSGKTIEDLSKAENPVFYKEDLLPRLENRALLLWKGKQYADAMRIHDLVVEHFPQWDFSKGAYNNYSNEYNEIVQKYLKVYESLFNRKDPAQAAYYLYQLRVIPGVYPFLVEYGETMGWKSKKAKISYQDMMAELDRQARGKIHYYSYGLSGGKLALFGRWEQDGDPSTTDPILWEVQTVSLSPTETAAVFESVSPLTECFWNTTMDSKDPASNYWENSDVRHFLNGEFLEKAFLPEERALLQERSYKNDFTVVNSFVDMIDGTRKANGGFVGSGGGETVDLVTVYCPYDYAVDLIQGETYEYWYDGWYGNYPKGIGTPLRYREEINQAPPFEYEIDQTIKHAVHPLVILKNET